MKEVTQDEFYKVIGPQDVVLNTIQPFPYTTEFKLRNGTLVGKAIDTWTDGVPNRWPIVKQYFLINKA